MIKIDKIKRLKVRNIFQKCVFALLLSFIVVSFVLTSPVLAYDRQKAVEYEDEWCNDGPDAKGYNPDYYDYSDPNKNPLGVSSGDCANFGSQCLIAGGIKFRSLTIPRVRVDDKGSVYSTFDLKASLTTDHGASSSYSLPNNLKEGDIIFLLDEVRNPYHTLVVVEKSGNSYSDIRVNTHTNDRYHKPLSDYADPSDSHGCAFILIPDSPIVTQVILMQNYKVIYHAYHSYTTNSIVVHTSEPATSGRISFKIIFDTTMDKNTLPVVTFGMNPPFDSYGVSGVGWSKTFYDYDTWEGYFDIPDDHEAHDGLHNISIFARGLDGSPIDPDEDLSIYDKNNIIPDTLHQFKIGPPCKVKIDNPYFTIPNGQTRAHHIKVRNNWIPEDKLPITLSTVITNPGGWTVVDGVNGQQINIPPGQESQEYTITVTNNGALRDLDIIIKSEADGLSCDYELYDGTPADDHIGDHPDDCHSISNSKYPNPWLIDTESNIGILLSGWGEGLGHLLGRYNISTALVKPDLTILGEPEKNLNDLSVLLIGSAGLTGYDNSPTFRSKLANFVENGGTLIVFSQQHGYEFNALPGGNVSAYGWLEDQSCQHASIGIATYHPILSGQDSVTSDANVDGYFTKYPENTTILLSRTKNGMPAMLMYEFGNGTVITTTAYTDWAYGHSQATTDAKKLVRDMIAWSKSSRDVHSYGAGDTINISVNITSYIDLSAEKVVFIVIDPDNEVVDTVEVVTSVQPYETKIVNFSWTAPSQYGIYHIDYSLIDDEYGEVQQVHDAKMFAVSKYAENPDGWVWQWSEVTFAVTSTTETFAYNEERLVTLHVWNGGGTDRTIRVEYHRHHPGGYWGYEGSVEMFAPAHGEGASILNLKKWGRGGLVYAEFYDEDNNCMGHAVYPIYVYHPSISVNIKADKQEYGKGEWVSISSDLENKQSSTYNTTVIVRALDSDNAMIFEDSSYTTLAAYTSENKTLRFLLPSTSRRGIYLITAEAYTDGNKIGSGSTYIKVRNYNIKMNFDKPDKAYRIRENMSIVLEIQNVGSTLWNSEVNISIPDLAFADSKYVSLAPYKTEKTSYNLNIPETTPAGKHDIIVTIGCDNSVKQYYFVIPNSNLVLYSEKTSYNAGDNLSINLTNIGGVDTTYNCSIKFYDLHALLIYENDTVQECIMAGENKQIEFKIPDQAVSGIYYLIVEHKDLDTSEITRLVKPYDINGLEASLTMVTEKKVYFSDDVSILTNITNLGGEIVNGTLNLKIGYSYAHNSTTTSTSYSKANANQRMPLFETSEDTEFDSIDLMTRQPYQHPLPVNELKDILSHPTSPEHIDHFFDLELPVEESNYGYYKTGIGKLNTIEIGDKNRWENKNASNTSVMDNSDHVSGSNISLSSNTWYVPDDYSTIQAAVDNATTGDTIIVKSGTYRENVVVNKQLTLSGVDTGGGMPVVDAERLRSTIKLIADGITLEGFKAINSSGGNIVFAGIDVTSNNNTITNNNASDNPFGIFLSDSSNNNIKGNNVGGNSKGIYLTYHSTNNTLARNNVSNNEYNGVTLHSSGHNTLRDNLMSGNHYNFGAWGESYTELDNDIDTSNLVDGKPIYYLVDDFGTFVDLSSNAGTVYCINCDNITVKNLTLTNNSYGIYFYNTSNSRIQSNYISNNGYGGICLSSSSNNMIENNNASDNPVGIYFSTSGNNVITGNTVSNNGGVIHLSSSINNTIENNNASDNPVGICLSSSGNNVITGNTACKNTKGIHLSSSINNTIENNNASNNFYGLHFISSSNNNIILNNTANNNHYGIHLSSNANTVSNNNASNNWYGIYLPYSDNNVITGNTVSNNGEGILLDCSGHNTLRNNLMSGNHYNFGVWGNSYTLDNDIDTSNLVDEKPIYYLVGDSGTFVDSSSNAGTVYCINCDNITVKDLTLTNNSHGIRFYNTSNSRIQSNYISNNEDSISLSHSSNNNLTNNTASSNNCGIWLDYSSYNYVTGNTLSSNFDCIFLYHSSNNNLTNNTASNNQRGIYLRYSSNNDITSNTANSNNFGINLADSDYNLIYNNYFDNPINAYDNGINLWNIPKTSGANIVGGSWLGGNYWSDYKGVDEDGDGIGDFLLPYNCSGNIQNGGDYLPLLPVEPAPPIGETIWEKNITIEMGENETKNVVIDVPPDALKNVTGKLELIAIFYNDLNPPQAINQSDKHSFFITDKNTSLILETDKRVYKPNETITIYGEVKNTAIITDDYNFSIKKNGEEIFSDTFTLSSGEIYNFNTSTTSNVPLTLEGTANDVVVTDFVKVEPPTVNVTVITPDVVGLEDFDIVTLIENAGDVPADLKVSIENNIRNITIPEKESKLIKTTMNITKNTTLTVNISGDVNQTIQKEIICGENARIKITPQPTHLEGTVEIPYVIENAGLLDSRFNATFSIDNQSVSESFFVPSGENIANSVVFNLTKGSHLLKYTSPLEEVNETINVLSPPEFIVASIHPEDMNFTLGQNVTITFIVENTGGTEGEVTLRLLMPDFEDTNRTWVRPGEKENMSFSFVIPDDLEEKNYKGIYELDGKRDEFTFFVQGAKISVNASLDKNLYEEGETAIFTLDVTNECPFDLSLYTRIKLSDYEEIKQFNLTDFETLQFDVPVHFNGQKLFYGIYMESGRALYLNGMYVHKKEIITLYTDKQVYNAGENVTIFVDTTKSGTLNLTAPEFNKNMLLTGLATIEFELPEEMRSGTYYIEYDFDNFSSAYPFDVIGYSARILECSLDKEVYDPVDIMNVKMKVEINQNITGVLKTWIYDSQNNLIDTFETDENFQEGENKIVLSRILSSDHSGIHVLSYGIYAPNDLIFLASGAEYFDVISQSTPPSAITNLHPTAGTTWINWTWTNPTDPDFNHTEIYLNGVFRTITSSEHYNATNLTPETIYTISTRTVDTSGNINQTWMNDTTTTLPASDTTIQLTISLDSGWNLISPPLNLTTWKLGNESVVSNPLNVTPENSLAAIYRYNTTSELFEMCSHYAGWGWDTAIGSESFTELEPGKGYWVMADNDCTLTFTGTAPSDLDISLDADWNCVGWYSTSVAELGQESLVVDPFNVTPANSLAAIYRYNTTSELFEMCSHYAGWGWDTAIGSESFTELEPGKGYWVWADSTCVWNHET